MTFALLLVAVLAASDPATQSVPNDAQFKSVRLGWGCIDVPTTYRVVHTPTSIIDQAYGFIDSPDKRRVEWSFGPSERHPLCHHKCRTVWQRHEILGGHQRVVGLMREADKNVYFAVDEWISFRISADGPTALDYLRRLVAGYHRRPNPEKCLALESE